MSQIPQTMLAIEIASPGGPEMLRPTQRPVPALQPGEVLIRVTAAGVNRPDVVQRAGRYPPPPGVTDIPGLEVSGEIVQTAPDVTRWRPGDAVCALVAGGGYAEYVNAPAAQCLPIPAGVNIEDAAGLPETFFTVLLNVFERAALQPGETLLVHGGSSGIGTTAILLAKAFGAFVIVTAGTARKCAACLDLGADVAINYREQDFVSEVLAATNQQGADVILDMVAGPYVARNMEAAAVEGRIAVIAVPGAPKSEVDMRRLLVRRLRLMGSVLRPQSVQVKGRLAAELRARVWPLFDSGRLRAPPVHARLPLSEAAQAHALMESGEHIGKIILLR